MTDIVPPGYWDKLTKLLSEAETLPCPPEDNCPRCKGTGQVYVNKAPNIEGVYNARLVLEKCNHK